MQLCRVLFITITLSLIKSVVLAPTELTNEDSDKPQHISNLGTSEAKHHSKERRNIDYYDYRHVVADGVQKALDECRQKFRWDRWNCPKKAFLSILDRDEFSTGQSSPPSNKELGLTRALIASGIVLSMIRSCSYGTSSLCGCTNPTVVPIQNSDILTGADHYTDRMMGMSEASGHVNQDLNMDQSMQPADQVPNHKLANDLPPTGVTALTSVNNNGGGVHPQGNKRSKFAWAGCDEIVKFGFKVAKMYLDSQDGVQADASKLINAHNYEAGRHAVKRTMRRRCKCHGVSGACQVNTCWSIVPDMSEVGDYLKRQYRVAAKVGAISAKETDASSLTKELSSISSEKLVFADASPDYCYENKQLGINGTLGRYCSRAKHRPDGTEVSRSERDSCDRLCTKCGYKIKKENIHLVKQCQCRFVYCCSVECKRCPHVEETFKCVRHS